MKIITNLKTTTTRQKSLNNNNKFYKKNGVHFVLVNYSWAWSLPWTVIDILSDTSLEKVCFPTPQQVSITILSYGGTVFQFFLLCAWSFVCFKPL